MMMMMMMTAMCVMCVDDCYSGYSRSEGYPYPAGMHAEADALITHSITVWCGEDHCTWRISGGE